MTFSQALLAFAVEYVINRDDATEEEIRYSLIFHTTQKNRLPAEKSSR
jgi:hypothetical protein